MALNEKTFQEFKKIGTEAENKSTQNLIRATPSKTET